MRKAKKTRTSPVVKLKEKLAVAKEALHDANQTISRQESDIQDQIKKVTYRDGQLMDLGNKFRKIEDEKLRIEVQNSKLLEEKAHLWDLVVYFKQKAQEGDD